MIIFSPLIYPEIVLLITGCLALIGHCFGGHRFKKLAYIISLVGVLLAFICLVKNLSVYSALSGSFYWSSQFVLDTLARVLKISVLGMGFLVIYYSKHYAHENHLSTGEYFPLMIFSILGMCFLISGHGLLLIYIGLELMSLPIYALITIKKTQKLNTEAALKYFVMGAVASGLILYGMSILYGVTQSIEISEIAVKVAQLHSHYELVLLGIGSVLILSGIAFKLGLVPFHMWLPDVYEGAPLSVVLLIATLPKLAIFAMFLRILFEGVTVFSTHWQHVILVIALLSIALGNIVAVAQTNIKRLFGYSTIAHMGFIALGIYTANGDGLSGSLYYIVSYALMSLAGFGLLLLFSKKGLSIEKTADLKGLNNQYPFYTFLFLLVILSMAGIPPMIGFYAKLLVLQVLVHQGHVYVATFAIFFSVIGAYYYLRLVKTMYFDNANNELTVMTTKSNAFVLALNSLSLLVLGLFPAALIEVCRLHLI